MEHEIGRALAPLVGLPLWGPERRSNMLSLRIGGANGDPRAAHALHVFCAWRLVRGSELIAGSGDLFTPADPDEEPETFDYDEPDATWWDERLRGYFAGGAPVVTAAAADVLGGVRLDLADGARLEVIPNSSPAPHVETEFWRLVPPAPGASHFVVGTGGIERDAQLPDA
jgi:hypothetical protein